MTRGIVLPALVAASLLAAACGGAAPSAPAHPASHTATPSSAAAPAAAAPAKAAPAAAPAKLIKMTVGYGNTSGTYTPIYVAKEQGFFARNGLNVRLVNSHGGPRGVTLLMSGAAQISLVDGDAAVAAIGRGLPLELLGSDLNDYGFECWSKPSIKTVADLKGLRLGVSEPGSGVTSSAIDMLARAGLQAGSGPSKVHLIYFPSVPERVAALVAGKVDAIVASVPQIYRVKSQGFKLLYDLAKLPYIDNGYMAKRSFVKAHPAEIKDFIKATIEAVAYTKNRAHLKQILADMGKYTQITSNKLLLEGYDYYVNQWKSNPTITPAQLNVSLRFVAAQDHEHVTSSQVLNQTLLNQVLKSGA